MSHPSAGRTVCYIPCFIGPLWMIRQQIQWTVFWSSSGRVRAICFLSRRCMCQLFGWLGIANALVSAVCTSLVSELLICWDENIHRLHSDLATISKFIMHDQAVNSPPFCDPLQSYQVPELNQTANKDYASLTQKEYRAWNVVSSGFTSDSSSNILLQFYVLHVSLRRSSLVLELISHLL